jgi:hypothetical protein
MLEVALSLCSWLASSFKRVAANHHEWRFDPDSASALLQDHMDTDMWCAVHRPPPWCRAVHCVVATRNSRWSAPAQAAHLEDLRASSSQSRTSVHFVDAGHWVHVDRAEDTAAIVAMALRDRTPFALV